MRVEIFDIKAYNTLMIIKEMEMRSEISKDIEILTGGIGEIPATETVPFLERAAIRTKVLGWKGEFWDGLRQNLEGASVWIKTEKAGLVKKTLSAVVGISFLTTVTSACAKGPGTPYIPSETAPRVMEVSPTTTSAHPSKPINILSTSTVVESGKLKPRCGGWPGLEKNGQPDNGTISDLANLASECNAMGQSKGTVKIFTFNADTKFPTSIDASQAIVTEDEVIKFSNLELQPTNFNQDWTDLTGRKHPRGVILTVPSGYGVASGFEVTAPEGGWVLITTDAANTKLAKYMLFRLAYWH
jgi:hypothetical protein